VNEPAPPAYSRRVIIYLRALLRFAVFVLAGPPIAAIVVIAGFAVRSSPEHLLRDLPLALATGYGIGAIPAAVIGFIVAVRDILSRPVNLALAALLGAVVGAIWAVYLVNEGQDYVLAVLVFVGSVVATAVCWWATRRLERSEVVK
jgi:hypothetical protein